MVLNRRTKKTHSNLDSSFSLLNIQVKIKYESTYLLHDDYIQIFRILCPLGKYECPLTSQTFQNY